MRGRVALVVCLAVAGCALRSEPFQVTPAAELGELEARVAADSADLDAVLALASGYLAQDRGEEARRLLAATAEERPQDRTLRLLLGVAAELEEDYRDARDHYAHFLADRRYDPLAPGVQARLDAIREQVAAADARALVAGEADPAAVPGEVALLPFRYRGPDPAGAELSAGLRQMMEWDLGAGQVMDGALTDAVLQGAGLAPDPSLHTALEVARLTGAGTVVGGELVETEGAVRIRALVVLGSGPTVREINLEGPPDLLVPLFKRMTLRIHDALGRRLHPMEAGAITRPQTLQRGALAALGRGVAAARISDHQAAWDRYLEALGVDPTFGEAHQMAERSRRVLATLEAPLAGILTEAGRAGERQRAVAALRERPGSAQLREFGGVARQGRSPLAELLGRDHVGVNALLGLIFVLDPGGAP